MSLREANTSSHTGQGLHLRILPCPVSDGTMHTLNALNSVIRFVFGIILHHSIVITVHDISLSVDARFFYAVLLEFFI
jgi:hypothetical protein